MRLKSLHYCHFTHHRLADQCQIISPDQSFGAMAEKAIDYLNAGVARVWIADPKITEHFGFYAR